MQIFFILLGLGGTAYAAFARRRFDWYSIGWFGACAYFLPGWLGYSQVKTLDRIPLLPGCYAVLYMVLIGILLCMLWTDRHPEHTRRPSHPLWRHLNRDALPVVMTVISILLLVNAVRIAGAAMFIPDKGDMVVHFTRWHNLWKTSTVMAAVLCFAAKRYRLLAWNIAHLLFLVYIGSRAHFVLASIGMLTLHLHRRGPQRLVLVHRWAALAFVLLAVFTVTYKQIYGAVKRGDTIAIRERFTGGGFIARAIIETEASQQCTIINDVMLHDVRVGPRHLAGAIRHAFTNPFRPEWDRVPSSFNDKIQGTLYPDRLGGVASSYWAEMWSSLGWPGVVAFLVLFLALCGFGNRWMATPPITRGVVAAWMPYWAFLVHRNDTTSMMSFFLKQFVLLLVLALLITVLTERVQAHVKRRAGRCASS